MWTPSSGDKKIGVVLANFQSSTIPFTLSLRLGDTVQILEESSTGWYRGSTIENKHVKGIFPANYVSIKKHRLSNAGPFEWAVLEEDGMVREISSTLRQWMLSLTRLYPDFGKRSLYFGLHRVMADLLEVRKELLADRETEDNVLRLKLRAATLIDWGNKKLCLDLVPRINGTQVDPDEISLIQLYQIHRESEELSLPFQTPTSVLPSVPPRPRPPNFDPTLPPPPLPKRHLYVHVRGLEIPSQPSGNTLVMDFDLFEIQVSTFDAAENRFLHQQFVCERRQGETPLTSGNPKGTPSVLFTDFEAEDVKHLQFKDLYLVARIYRQSLYPNMPPNQPNCDSLKRKSKLKLAKFRKPFAVGVLGLSNLMTGVGSEVEEEQLMRLYCSQDTEFYHLHQMLARKQLNKASILPGAGLSVSLQVMKGIVKDETTFKGMLISRRTDDPLLPDSLKHELCLTIESGEFEKSGKSSPRNIQVSVSLIDEHGKLLPDCMRNSCGEDVKGGEFSPSVIYRCNNPRWRERTRVHLPLPPPLSPLTPHPHLRFLIRHCSTKEKQDRKLLGFAVLPLVDAKGTAILSGSHSLSVFKCEDVGKLKDPYKYLCVPWQRGYWGGGGSGEEGAGGEGGPDPPSFHPFSFLPNNSIRVSISLSSNLLSENKDIHSLLQWRLHPDFLPDVLKRFMGIALSEIFPFLYDVLDTLFSLMATDTGSLTPNSALVFRVFGHVVDFPDSPHNFHALYTAALHQYAHTRFSATNIDRVLLQYVQSIANQMSVEPAKLDQEESIQMFYSLHWFFLFAIRSYQCKVSKSRVGEEEELECLRDFKQRVKSVVGSCGEIFRSPFASTAMTAQTGILKCGASMFSHLSGVFHPSFVSSTATSFLNALRLDSHLEPTILTFLHPLVHSPLFTNIDSHETLLIPVLRILGAFFSAREQLDVTTEILCKIVQQYHSAANTDSNSKHMLCQNIGFIAEYLFESLVATILETDKASPLLGKLVTCLFELLKLMTSSDYERLVISLKISGGRKHLKDFFFRLFLVFRDLIRIPSEHQNSLSISTDSTNICGGRKDDLIVPNRWRIIKLAISNILLTTMQEISDILYLQFFECNSFDYQLWSTYFNLSANFITQPSLQLEPLPPAKASNISQRYGDMRTSMCFQFSSLWGRLGEKRGSFLPTIVGPLLEVSLIPQSDLRRASIPLFFDLFEAQYCKSGKMSELEMVLFDKLEVLVGEGHGDMEYKTLFRTIVLGRMEEEGVAWRGEGQVLVERVGRLLGLLLDYWAVSEGSSNIDKRMFCTMNLLEFYDKEVRGEDSCGRYIHKLHHLLLNHKYWTEAAGVLRLYTNGLGWERRTLHSDDFGPVQTEWERKERMYETMIEYFDKGKCWERAIELCKQLCIMYETVVYDYRKLGSTLKRMADMYNKILGSGDREEPEYFRVAFYGQGFPRFIQNKVLVYRGHAYEKIGAFTQRISVEWPEATVLPFGTTKDDTLAVSTKQYLQMCNVKPMATGKPELSSMDASETIKRYHRLNDISCFRYFRPLSAKPDNTSNQAQRASDFQNLWTERTTIRTESVLPGVLPWAEVVSEESEVVSPVQNACLIVKEKNEELRRLAVQYGSYVSNTSERLRGAFSQPLLMVLKGTVEAAVNGGIAMYHKAFFNSDFSFTTPEEHGNLQELRMLLWEQMEILERCLRISAQLVPEECRPLQSHLLTCFDQLRNEMKRNLDSPQLRRISGNYAKFSLPCTPETSLNPQRLSKHRSVDNRRYGQTEWMLSNSWDPTFGDEESDENMYDSVAHSSGTDEDALAPLHNGRRKTSSRPCSVHWESSVEDMKRCGKRSSSVHGNLSNSHQNPFTLVQSGSPGRLRRLVAKLSGSGSGLRISRGERSSEDSGIEREGKERHSRSPKWSRKFSSPFNSFTSLAKPQSYKYRQLGNSLNREDSRRGGKSEKVTASLSLSLEMSSNTHPPPRQRRSLSRHRTPPPPPTLIHYTPTLTQS